MRRRILWASLSGAVLASASLLPDLWVLHEGQRNLLTSPRQIRPGLVVVPGASVFRNGRLSPVLKERVDAALLAMRAWPASRLLLSGTAIAGGYDEVGAMRRYACARGMDSTRILVDREGQSTQETIGRIPDFQPDGAPAVIITQSWHMPRCLWLGRRQDLKGLVCDRPRLTTAILLRLREHLARIDNFWRSFL